MFINVHLGLFWLNVVILVQIYGYEMGMKIERFIEQGLVTLRPGRYMYAQHQLGVRYRENKVVSDFALERTGDFIAMRVC